MMLTRALSALRPGVEFTFNNEDLSTIKWSVEGTTTPTQAEVNAKIVELEAVDTAKVTARQSALAKLAALGLTAEEIAAL
jgi:DNA-binding NarL/FixJ family response regulator